MPSPKIMGIAGGSLVLLLAIWMFVSGGISLPAFASDPTAFIDKAATDYKQLASGTISEEQWKTYSSAVKKEAGEIIGQYAQVSPLNSEQTEQRKIVAALMSLATCSYDDTEKQKKHFTKFEELMED